MTARPRRRWSSSLLESLETFCRLLLLNLLWVASLLPVVTAPGGTRAMFETLASWREGPDLPVAPVWFASLRRHWARAALEALPLAVVGALLTVNFVIAPLMGSQRTVVFTALLAVVIPYLLIVANLQPALAGRTEASVREGYGLAIRDLVRSPWPAIVILVITMAAVMLVYLQPLLILLVPAPAARLMLTVRTHLVHPVKEHA